MWSTCGCLCAIAGHYGICQVTPIPGRRHITASVAFSKSSDVCAACYEAVVRSRIDPARVLRERIASNQESECSS